ncbi:MAG: hypothetical protein U0802_14995 [Candidatus Binatia bacterium]
MPTLPRLRLLLAASCLMVAAPAGAAPAPTDTPAPMPTVWSGAKPPFGLSGGADSQEALLDQFVAGLTAGDMDALNRLRVTQQEYGSIIVPGMVAKGTPPRTTFEKVNIVFFGMLDSRSRYALQALVERFKGKKIVRREVRFTEPTQEWAWYTARGDTALVLVDDQGERYEMKTGWIAEVDGHFKFVGFNWDN